MRRAAGKPFPETSARTNAISSYWCTKHFIKVSANHVRRHTLSRKLETVPAGRFRQKLPLNCSGELKLVLEHSPAHICLQTEQEYDHRRKQNESARAVIKRLRCRGCRTPCGPLR